MLNRAENDGEQGTRSNGLWSSLLVSSSIFCHLLTTSSQFSFFYLVNFVALVDFVLGSLLFQRAAVDIPFAQDCSKYQRFLLHACCSALVELVAQCCTQSSPQHVTFFSKEPLHPSRFQFYSPKVYVNCL